MNEVEFTLKWLGAMKKLQHMVYIPCLGKNKTDEMFPLTQGKVVSNERTLFGDRSFNDRYVDSFKNEN